MADLAQNDDAVDQAPVMNDGDTQHDDADASAFQGQIHSGAVNNEIVPPSDPSRAWRGCQRGSQPWDEPGDDPGDEPGGEPDPSSSDDDDDDGNDNDEDDGDGDADNDSQSDVDFQGDCLKKCEPPFKNRREAAFRRKRIILRLRSQLAGSRGRERNLRIKNAALKQELFQMRLRLAGYEQSGRTGRAGQTRRPRKTKATWPERLAQKLLGRSRETAGEIYKLACNEENSSYKYIYPGLKLRGPSLTEWQEYRARPRWTASNSARTAPIHNATPSSGRKLFSELPSSFLRDLLRHLLVFDGKPVHCVSRLDPHCTSGFRLDLPAGMAALDAQGTGLNLLHRFLIGNGSFSLTCEIPPKMLLAPLAGRFAQGIGNRLQRVQLISLFWIGNQDVCYVKNDRGKYTSRRTHALSYFPQAIRAKHIELYFRESDPWYMRRKHEPRGMILYHKEQSLNQPDMRLLRDMHTVQGLMNIKCLRGVHSIRFYDYDQYDKRGEKEVCIRNHNFVRQVNEETERDKAPQKKRLAEFQNLGPLVASRPSTADFLWVKNAIRMERERNGDRLEDEPEDETDDDSHGLTPGFNGNNGADNDDNDSDGDGHYPRGGKQCARYANGATSTQACVVEVGDDDDAIMDDAPWEENQGDDEMSDNEQDGDNDGDAVMSDASQDEYEFDDGYDDEDGYRGAPLHPPPRPAAPGGHNDASPSLFIDGVSPQRDPNPGQSQPAYRFSLTEGFATTTAAAAAPGEVGEESLFVEDYEADDAEQGGAPVVGPPPRQAWENTPSSDDEDDEGGKEESTSDDDGSGDEEKEEGDEEGEEEDQI